MKHHLKVFIFIIIIITLFQQLYLQKNEIDNKELNKNSNDSSNSEPNKTNDEYKKNNYIDYDVVNNYTIENDNIEINFYKSKIPRVNITSDYKGFIEIKNEFYFNLFKKFNYKYLPENEDYNKTIYNLSIYWFISAGFVAIFFIAYFILRVFFRKFRGAKDDNIHPDDKIFLWILFGNKIFLI
jgi:hypothetical protein